MDPSSTESAPPAGWSEEKSATGPAAPPPYQDTAYPAQPQGYGAPAQYVAGQPYPPQTYPAQAYPPQAVTVQPAVYVTQGPLANPVNDYLGYSIFTMLCCCLPLGIAALIYSLSAREANQRGDRTSAERSSNTARILNHVALGIGIGVFVLSIILVMVAYMSVY